MSKLGRNFVWNLLGQAGPVLAAVFTVPVLIRGLGPERFGVLTLIWFIVGYFSIFDLGLGRALTQLLADRLGRGEEESAPALVWTALGLMACLGLVGTGVAALSAPALQQALKAPATLRIEMLDALYLLALSIPLVVGASGLRGVLEARQRFDLANVVRLASGMYTYVGPVCVLAFSRSLVPITLVLIGGRVITWLAYLIACLHELPQLRRQFRFERTYVRTLLRLGGWMTVSNLVGPILVYLDRFLIATSIGAAAVAYYVTPFEIVTRLLLLPMALAGVLFPLIASTFSQHPQRSARLFSRGIRLVFVALFPFVLVVIAFAHEGLALWVGETIAGHSDRVLQWLAVGVFLNGLVQVPFATIQAAGRADLTAKIHLIELPLYLPILWWTAHRWGIDGAAAAWMVRSGLDLLIQAVVAIRLFPARSQYGSGESQGSVGAGLGTAGLAVMAFVFAALLPTLYDRAVLVSVVLVGFGGLAWTQMLDVDDRAFVRNIITRASARIRVA